MKQAFVNKRFNDAAQAIIDTANSILTRYQGQNLKVTLRQLYYVFIAQDLFPATWIDAEYNAKNGLDSQTKNTVKNYKRLGGIINDGRLAGAIDWDVVEDRLRVPNAPSEFQSLESLIEAAFRAFRLPRWHGQEYYTELWVEKDALSGVLEPLGDEFHVTIMVNRGYSSQSAMYRAGLRFARKENDGFTTRLIYLGDHDPSGEDMVRDVQDRLRMYGSEVTVQKLALTMDQVEEYTPPPNPTKMSDSRADKYVDKHGNQSWEVDALPPEVLQQLVRDRLEELVDHDKMDKVIAKEDREKKLLRKAVKDLRKKTGDEEDGED